MLCQRQRMEEQTAGRMDLKSMLEAMSLEEKEHTYATFAETYLKVS